MNFVQFVNQYQYYSGGMAHLIKVVFNHLSKKEKHPSLLTIATPNPEQLIQAWENPHFASCLKQFDYLLPDGVGLVLLSKVKRSVKTIERKIAGVDLVRELILLASQEKWPVLIIGGRAYAKRLVTLDKGRALHIVELQPNDLGLQNFSHQADKELYWLEGFSDIARPKQSEKQYIERILGVLKPKLVFVGLGAPNQELWIQDQREMMARAGVRLAMAVGGTFDMLTGLLPRAPKLLQNLQLEWLWRLIIQPTRIKRQLRLIKFIQLSLTN